MFYCRIGFMGLSFIFMALSHYRGIMYVKYAHIMMILRLICSSGLLKDEPDPFKNKLAMLRMIIRYNSLTLNIMI
jgi:hypothetical protein